MFLGARAPGRPKIFDSTRTVFFRFLFMNLTFNRGRMRTILGHSTHAGKWKSLHGRPETEKAGLWLVGDDGIYFMSNGHPAFLDPEEEAKDPKTTTQFVCYANECDPTRCAFDEWWSAKRIAFGGSDGVEFVGANTIENWLNSMPEDFSYVVMNLTRFQMQFMTEAPKLNMEVIPDLRKPKKKNVRNDRAKRT